MTNYQQSLYLATDVHSYLVRRRCQIRLLFCPLIIAAMGISGCSTDSAARLYAQQNEAAQLRQEAENKPAKPDNKGMYIGLIRQMQKEGLYFASLAHIDSYEQQYGKAPDVERLRADALRETRQGEAAEATYRELLNTPEAAAAWHGLGLLAAQNGNYAGAVPLLLAASKLEPINPIMLSDLGYAHLRSGDTNGARVPLAQAAELAPDDRKIIANLALLLLVSGEGSKARSVMDRAKFSPESRTKILKLAEQIKLTRPPALTVAPSAQRPALTVPPPVPAATSDAVPIGPTNRFQTMLDRFKGGG